jgi:hypothetical protein
VVGNPLSGGPVGTLHSQRWWGVGKSLGLDRGRAAVFLAVLIEGKGT